MSSHLPSYPASRPFHFQLRPDLIDELCAGDAIVRNLPQQASHHDYWLQVCGLAETEAPFAQLQQRRRQPYQQTSRYVLQAMIPPGERIYANIVTDGNHWVGRLEYFGLVDFVFRRAIMWAMQQGVSLGDAIIKLRPRSLKNPIGTRTVASWAVGYQPVSGDGPGLAVLLATDHRNAIRDFLAGKASFPAAL